MGNCHDCPKPTSNDKLAEAIRNAKEVAKKNNWPVYAIVERANKTGYIICSADDERCQRLRVAAYYTLG